MICFCEVRCKKLSNVIEGIVVAKSRKYLGYCVVVFDLERKVFHRIISDNFGCRDGELSDGDCLATNGKSISNLDVISFSVKSLDYAQDDLQKENLILDSSRKMEIIRKADKAELVKLYGEKNLNLMPEIFKNQWGSMTINDALQCSHSFMLARVFGLEFYSAPNKNDEYACKCSFKYNGIEYKDVSVTISKTKEEDLLKYAGNRYPNGLVGFSFGHPYEEKCFKYLCSFLGVLPWKK